MGCTGSTAKDVEKQNEVSGAQPVTPPRVEGGNSEKTDPPQNRANTVSINGESVVLPAGEWVKAQGMDYFYSQAENLYYHPSSCQFYDPTNEMWFDPLKQEWYRDEDDEAQL